jgi:hypothetical protein
MNWVLTLFTASGMALGQVEALWDAMLLSGSLKREHLRYAWLRSLGAAYKSYWGSSLTLGLAQAGASQVRAVIIINTRWLCHPLHWS